MRIRFARVKEELSRVKAAIVMNKKNGPKYLLPKTLTDLQKKIYSALEIPYSTVAQKIN